MELVHGQLSMEQLTSLAHASRARGRIGVTEFAIDAKAQRAMKEFLDALVETTSTASAEIAEDAAPERPAAQKRTPITPFVASE
jgi:hypothetical protein